MKNIIQKIALLATALAAAASASENIYNYSAPITVGAFLQWGDTLYAASSGGLVVHDLKSGVKEFVGNGRVFPDLYLTALCRDDGGNVWIGSRKGYLYKRSPRGQYTVFSTYKQSGWSITALFHYDGMIVVGSDRGVSLFDPVRGVATRNATSIAHFDNPRVNAIESDGDTLFLGCDEGVAFLDSLYDAPLSQRNLYYPKIWKTRGSGPVTAFVDTYRGIIPASKPTAVFGGVLVTADSDGWISSTVGGSVVRNARIAAYGGITTLYNEGDRRLWAGTEDMFYYSWSGGMEQPKQHIVGNGYTLRMASRVLTAPNGDAWVLPFVNYPDISWYHGVYRFDGSNWQIYGSYNHYDGFGYIGDGSSLGAAFWRDSSIWVGTYGGNVKHIKPATNEVGQLVVGNRGYSGFSYMVGGWGENDWGKVDAVAADSSGYLWITAYDSDFGSLICYDPRYKPVSWEADPSKAHFRRFFTEPPLKTENVGMLTVDASGRIFAYDGTQNRLTVISHGGNPLVNGIKIDTSYESVGTLLAIEADRNGDVYTVGPGGLKKITAGKLAMETLDNTLSGVSSMAIGDEGVLWLGTSASGVLRYDVAKKEARRIDESSGLSSNSVVSVALDRKNGRLWVATEDGISMLDVGKTSSGSKKQPLRAIPNVYSVSGSAQGAAQITFTGLEPKSSVAVYTINGALAARVSAMYYSEHEWRAAWTPKRNLAPGTYLAIAKPGGKRAKLIIKP